MSAHRCGPACNHPAIQIDLTVAEQRKLAEAETGEPCFRMWLSREEFEKASFADWTAYPIGTDVVAIWRKRSDMTKLLESNNPADRDLGLMLQSRELIDIIGPMTEAELLIGLQDVGLYASDNRDTVNDGLGIASDRGQV